MKSSARRLSRVAPAIAVSALIAGALFATPGAAFGAAPASTSVDVAAADSASGGVAIAVSSADDGTATAGADLVLTVEISNPGSDALSDGTVEIALGRDALTTSTEFDAWIDGSSAATTTVDTVATAPSPALGPTSSHLLQITVPAAQIDPSLFDDGWGVYPLRAQVTAGGTTVASTASTIVWSDGASTAPAATSVTVIAPITSVASSTGLIQSAALEAFTSDTGVLTRELDAVFGRPVTIAVDPRIIASIRALGSTAPASAVAWLERLDAAPNPIIPLTYGDSDISGERQAGAASVLQPTSLAYALKAANFVNVSQIIEPAGATDAATPTPSPTPAGVPTLEQLLSWDYTSTAVAWPRSGAASTADLPFFAASGLTTTIVDSSQVTAPAATAGGTADLDATALVGDQRVLVADHGVSQALQDSVSATSETRKGEALSQLAGSLAVAAGAAQSDDTAGAAPSQTLAVLDRSAMNLSSIDDALSVIQSRSWSTTGTLDDLLATTPTQTVTLTDATEDAQRVAQIRTLLGSEQSVDAFSSVLSDPQVLTGEHRADLLALLSNSWVSNEGGWSVAAQASVTDDQKVLASVQIVEGSNINLLSNQAPLPVTISNELPYPVTVIVHVTPSNGRLLIDTNDEPITIEAGSRKGAQIPVTAVANGSVTLSFQLLSPSGVLVSTPSPVIVNVSADWETWGTVIIAGVIVVVFGIGVLRLILRRRKARTSAASATPDETGTDTDTDTDTDGTTTDESPPQ